MNEAEVLILLGGFTGGFVCGILVTTSIVLAALIYYRRLGPEDLD